MPHARKPKPVVAGNKVKKHRLGFRLEDSRSVLKEEQEGFVLAEQDEDVVQRKKRKVDYMHVGRGTAEESEGKTLRVSEGQNEGKSLRMSEGKSGAKSSWQSDGKAARKSEGKAVRGSEGQNGGKSLRMSEGKSGAKSSRQSEAKAARESEGKAVRESENKAARESEGKAVRGSECESGGELSRESEGKAARESEGKSKTKERGDTSKLKKKGGKSKSIAEDGLANDDKVEKVSVNGQRIQVQTQITKLAKDCNRPSVFIRLGAESFDAKFLKAWSEHVEGFVGMRGTKRNRTEKELDMEWRKRVEQLKKVKKVEHKSGQTVSDVERQLVVQKYRDLMAQKKKAMAEIAKAG